MKPELTGIGLEWFWGGWGCLRQTPETAPTFILAKGTEASGSQVSQGPVCGLRPEERKQDGFPCFGLESNKQRAGPKCDTNLPLQLGRELRAWCTLFLFPYVLTTIREVQGGDLLMATPADSAISSSLPDPTPRPWAFCSQGSAPGCQQSSSFQCPLTCHLP